MTSTEQRINDLYNLLSCVTADLAEALAERYGIANVNIRINSGQSSQNLIQQRNTFR